MAKKPKLYEAATLTRIIFPVAICMLVVMLNAKLLMSNEFEQTKKSKVLLGLFHSYHHNESVFTTLILFLFLAAATSLSVVCYKYRLKKVIKGYFILNVIFLFFFFFWWHLRCLSKAMNIPVSYLTVTFIVINFGCLGFISLHWKTPNRLNQFYLIMSAALTALFILLNVPDWTIWLMLLAMSLWDLFAVLAPFGPLRLLVETARRRYDDPFPAVLYNSMSYAIEVNSSSAQTDEAMISESRSRPTSPTNQDHSEVDEGVLRLGLGDFVFYSLMIANVVQTSNAQTTIACFVSNLVGLAIVLPIVTLSQKPLPALPFPLLFAAFFYFPSHIAITPFTNQFYDNFYVI